MASAIGAALLLAVLGATMFIALRSPLKDDIAWLLYVARRWMAGRELYIDLVEVNPPLIVWISAIPLEIAKWLDADPQFVAMPVFIAAVLACGWWAASLLQPRGGIFANRIPVFAAIGMVLLIVPAADLGQREHLMIAAFLPYLVLLARELDRGRVPFSAAILAGAMAGLGCALKPRYGLTFASLEILALCHGLRPWRMLPFAAGVTLIAYAGSVAVFCPAYLQRAVPMAVALYGATDVTFLALLSDSAALLAGEAVAIALLWLKRQQLRDYRLMLTLIVYAAAATVVCFIDGKDWYYHRIPAITATVLALTIWVATELHLHRFAVRWPLAMAVAAMTMFAVIAGQRLQPQAIDAVEQKQTAVDRLEHIIVAEHARTYVAFSEWLALGFPVVNETGVTWASRFDSMWALKGEVWRASFDPAAAKEWPIARWVTHDFIAGCPDIAVVDTRETTKYIPVLSAADPAFARAWKRYHPIASFDGLVVYKRGTGGCMDVWVATQQTKPHTAR
jgi:hypothetical protein